MNSYPKRIYKYFPISRLEQVLRDNLIRYSPIGSFNDLFEGRPKVTGITQLNEKSNYFGPDPMPSQDAISDVYDLVPNDVKPLITYGEMMLIAKYLEEIKISGKGKFPKDMGTFAIDFITRDIDKKIGVLCLSEVPDSILMWAHYGQQHSGFVLEFDGHHPYFHEAEESDISFDQLCRVQYRDTRPSIFLKEVSPIDLFLTKSSHWSYECEWRLLRSFDDKTVSDKGENDTQIHLFSFPAEAITGIILGARTKKQNYLDVKRIIGSKKDLGHISIKRALADATHFHLEISSVSENDYDLKFS